MKKINYGIDAPKVIRNLIVIGILLFIIFILLSFGLFPAISVLKFSFLSPAIFLLIAGFLMIAYSRYGKFRHRDRIINLHQWKGNEKVLDVGTGLGLLMIGTAKKLDSGKSYGIDIFNSYDLSDNNIDQTKNNIHLENVDDKTEIISENICKTTFSDNYFDVVVSNLCLHNIYNKEERKLACKEIFRVLKTGGEAIISDFKHTGEYKKVFEGLGMKVKKEGTYFFSTFPPLTIIKAIK
ncbi:MAG: class I SAM-dependent methyltransferase [Ginsengibacter sp.]